MADTLTFVWDLLFFAVLPYVALVTFFLGTIIRYRLYGFSYSSVT
jgi:nitrate reductase gamma subunit